MDPFFLLPLFPILFVAIVAATVGVGLYQWIVHGKDAQRRANETFALAQRLGLVFVERPPLAPYADLHPCQAGSTDRWIDYCASGLYRGRAVIGFNYTGKTVTHDKNGSHTTFYYRGVALVDLPVAFPQLTIVPETFALKLWDAVGGDDIDFESDEFSKAFWVKCADRKFAYDVVRPPTMEFLLLGRGSHERWELLGRHVAVYWDRHLEAAELEAALDRVVAFVELLPKFDLPDAARDPLPRPEERGDYTGFVVRRP